MKAILVIDIGDELLENYDDFTVNYELKATDRKRYKVSVIESIRYVEDCPLRPMPEKKTKIITENGKEPLLTTVAYLNGLNYCLNEIGGKNEDIN